MDVRSLRVSSTHAWSGSLSRRSEISSMGEWLVRVGATGLLAAVCEGCLGFAVLGSLVAGDCLGPTLTLGVDFVALPFLPVVSRSLRVGLETTGQGLGLGGGGEEALMTWPPRTTWFQPCPKLSCSAFGSGSCAFGVTGGLGALPTLLRTEGARLARAPLASFHFVQPR
jgi:hypothetical protein